MTQNQIAYWKYKEDQRHNVASEGETVRHNTVQEGETYRHDTVSENIDLLGAYAQQKSAESSYISAKASEKQAQVADYLKESKAYQSYASGNQSNTQARYTNLTADVYQDYGQKQAKANLVNTYTKSAKDIGQTITGVIDTIGSFLPTTSVTKTGGKIVSVLTKKGR